MVIIAGRRPDLLFRMIDLAMPDEPLVRGD
jgi:hypothetical protein